MKAQWDERGGRRLLGDNTGGGAVTLRPIRLQCARVNSLAYTYIVDHMYTRLRLAQNSTCARPSGRQLLRKSGSRNYEIFTGNSTLTKEHPIPKKNGYFDMRITPLLIYILCRHSCVFWTFHLEFEVYIKIFNARYPWTSSRRSL